MKLHLLAISILAFSFLTSCNNSPETNNDLTAVYTKMGNAVVKQTFDTLKSSLQTAISQSGFEGAVPFCQAAAFPITNTYASDSVTIRRTALKYRNFLNKPDTAEERILKMFASLKEKGIINDSIKPIIEIGKNSPIHFYKPIMLQQMCTSCHGNRDTDIQPSVWKAINRLYPSDMAYDFKTGDLRGMWHITFTKRNTK